MSIDEINSLIELITKTEKDANIDDRDEYLNIRDITNQVNINRENNCRDKAPSIPK